LAGSCPTSATATSLETDIDNLSAAVVTNTTVSPNVDDTEFTVIAPEAFPGTEYEKTTLHPICSGETPYYFFVKRGSLNKLLVYFQGGGACWNFLTCGLVGTFKRTAVPDRCRGGTNQGEPCSDLSDCPDQTALVTSCTPNGCTGGNNHGEP